MPVQTEVDAARTVLKLIDALEDSDDVQNVYTNFDMSAEVQAQLEAE
jgi:transcriptional/translational regulatory protein YebC/TACO1